MKVEILPILKDNYVFFIRDDNFDRTAVVDPGEYESVEKYLKSKNWNLTDIFITHHHHDHSDGLSYLKKKYKLEVYGSYNSKNNLIDYKLKNDKLKFCNQYIFSYHTPGHTLDHIIYFIPEIKSVFVGDLVFSLGCGRIFEGSISQMYDSINIVKNFGDDTKIYTAHEYSLKNAKFALYIEPNNENILKRYKEIINLRKLNLPTIPSLVIDEKKTNPFFRINKYYKNFNIAENYIIFKKLIYMRDGFK